MLWLIIVLLCFSECLATKDLNLIEVKYYPFMIKLSKCNGTDNAADNVSTKIGVPSETKEVAVKAFSSISIRNEVKT